MLQGRSDPWFDSPPPPTELEPAVKAGERAIRDWVELAAKCGLKG
jgi:hypothetical protein